MESLAADASDDVVQDMLAAMATETGEEKSTISPITNSELSKLTTSLRTIVQFVNAEAETEVSLIISTSSLDLRTTTQKNVINTHQILKEY